MAARTYKLNLLSNKALKTPQLLRIERQLQVTSIVLIIASLVVGVFVSAGFFVLRQNQRTLTSEKEALIAALTQNAQKETIYRTVQSRVPVVRGVLDEQLPVYSLITDIGNIAQPPILTSLEMDSQNNIIVNFEARSIFEALQITSDVIELGGQERLVEPFLDSFSIQDDGALRLSIKYQGIL